MEAVATLLAAGDRSFRVTSSWIVTLLIAASLVAIVARRLKLPYTVALVLAGVGLGATGLFHAVHLSKPIIVVVFLPPLVFEGALNLHHRELRRRWAQVGLLAVPGTLITTAGIAVLLVAVPGMGWKEAVTIAVVLGPTDPVSVLAIFKANGVAAGLRTLLEGESLFNDALGIVLYAVALDLISPGHHAGAWSAVGKLGTQIGVGVAAGLTVGFVAHRLMRTVADRLVEIMLSIATAYGAFLLAEQLHGSGLLASIVAGILIGHYDTERSMSPESEQALLEFWEVIAFLANSALFLLIGLAFAPSELADGHTAVAVGVAIAGMIACRVVISWGLLAPWLGGRDPAIERGWPAAICWGGLRGGVPIALVLGLEGRRLGDTNTEALVLAVVLFSLLVQGLTYAPLLRRLGLDQPRAERPARATSTG